MNVYKISYNDNKPVFIFASSKKAAMIKYFGVTRLDGATIEKVKED